MTERYKVLPVHKDDNEKRLDAICRKLLPSLSLGEIQKAIRSGDVRINHKKTVSTSRPKAGDELSVYSPLFLRGHVGPERKRTMKKKPRRWDGGSLKDLIVWENDRIMAFNKPRGLLVHGPSSLDIMVKSAYPSNSLSFQPGPLHRLDQNTSGLVVFSRSLDGARIFSSLLKAGKIGKQYLALLKGKLDRKQTCREPLSKDPETGMVKIDPQGRPAVTHFKPLLSERGMTLAVCTLETGRTHQIRVHAQTLGFPLAGDSRYGGGQLSGGFVLHAFKLVFPHEDGGSLLGPIPLIAPMPQPSVRTLYEALGLTPDRLKEILKREQE